MPSDRAGLHALAVWRKRASGFLFTLPYVALLLNCTSESRSASERTIAASGRADAVQSLTVQPADASVTLSAAQFAEAAAGAEASTLVRDYVCKTAKKEYDDATVKTLAAVWDRPKYKGAPNYEYRAKVLEASGPRTLFAVMELSGDRGKGYRYLTIETSNYMCVIDTFPARLAAQRLQRQGKGKEALELLENAVQINPLDGRTLAMCADAKWVLATRDVVPTDQDAIEHETSMRRALALAPYDPTVGMVLAQFLVDRGRYEEGIATLRAVHEWTEDHRELCVMEGRVLMAKGNMRKALKQFDKCAPEDYKKSEWQLRLEFAALGRRRRQKATIAHWGVDL